jgi:hypothetical protein
MKVACIRLFTFGMFALTNASILTRASADDPSGIEFFEKRIRPVLIERCYECHNSADTAEGGLELDHRDGMRSGGDSGPAIVPGKANTSLLLAAIRHDDDDLRMPKDNPKLSPTIVADFAQWIDAGAADPRDKPPSAEDLAKATSWEAIRDQRKQWWSFQPVSKPALPAVKDGAWSDHPVDRFILAGIEAAKLRPAKQADPRAIIRRMHLAITGLPPTIEEIDAFEKESIRDPQSAIRNLADRLLQSQHFGERWARHWMDWLRYAESHGSEGDPGIPHAWRYRDYLIRALNADVPYDQLVREHVAGDLLPNPRINAELGLNESAHGTAHFRFTEHGYAPTDALAAQVRFTENQIDVISKTFLGLTVSCARCHDHKFDAISQRDFYAMYGIMTSCRPGLVVVDAPDKLEANKKELRKLKLQLKSTLAAAWLKTADGLAIGEPPAAWTAAINEAARDARNPLHAWSRLNHAADGAALATQWKSLADQWQSSRDALQAREQAEVQLRWDLSGKDNAGWFVYGNGLDTKLNRAGAFVVATGGEQILANLFPGGVYSHLLSSKHNGVLTSPRFLVNMDELWIRTLGGGGARMRYSMQHYPRVTGPVYKSQNPGGDDFRWQRFDMRYWEGDHAYLEIATARDLPIEARGNERSWFGVAAVVGTKGGQPKPKDEIAEVVSPIFELPADDVPKVREAIGKSYGVALRLCIEAWQADTMTNEQANFLRFFVRRGLLPNKTSEIPTVAPLVAKYRELENEVPVPTRAPGMIEAGPRDHPLFVRGNHKQPGNPVPRSFLEAFDSAAYKTSGSGRLDLARDIASPKHPLMPRVMVNRLWHYLLGRGIVATTDNFGRLGQRPTHPELLDYLANQFVEQKYSVKSMIRLLVLSRTFQLDSAASDLAKQVDPDNRLLSHMRVRRLEAEAIRDSLLSVSGRLDRTMFGGPVGANSPRRSVYVAVRRNSLNQFLQVFDCPAPFTTVGNRNVTNVPAQSLAMMNDPFVIDMARGWAEQILSDGALPDDASRIGRLFKQGLGRAPTERELKHSQEFLAASDQGGAIDEQRWHDFAHAIFSIKEFIYIR